MYLYMTDHAGPRRYECDPVFQVVTREICNLVLKFYRQNLSSGHNFIVGFHNFSSGYAILVPGYKFRGCQFEIPGYTLNVGGRRGLSHAPKLIYI